MSRELLQQALEALSWIANVNAMDYEYQRKARDSIKALEQELAKPEQEPVAHLWECIGRWSAYLATNGKQGNLAPPTWLVDAVKAVAAPSKPWVGLTDDDHEDFANRTKLLPILAKTMAKFIEAKLKEKNK